EKLRHGAGLALLERLDFLEEVDEGRRIVARVVHVLEPEQVGFGLEPASEPEISKRDGESGSFIDSISDPAAHHDRRNGCELDESSTSRLTRAVPRGHVSD